MLAPCQPRPSSEAPDGSAPVPEPDEEQLCIERVERIPPFLMTVVSDSDLWMFVSSTGGLTCGRQRAERCLFPYETDDRLHRNAGLIGPFTELTVRVGEGRPVRWRPFAPEIEADATRNLYKTVLGHQVVFEEIRDDLGLTFRYRWANARNHGFVRTAELVRHADAAEPASIALLDGLLDIMPSGVELTTQQRASALVNAYRHAELDERTGRLAIYRLSALIVDRAEPAESLTCNLVWSTGLEGARVRLHRERDTSTIEGRPASYLLEADLELAPGEAKRWDIVGDVGLSQADVVHRRDLPTKADAAARLDAAIAEDGRALTRRLAKSDGLQRTASAKNDAHHLANVLFNCMRGGVFVDGDRAPGADVQRFLRTRNRRVAERHRAFLDGLGSTVRCTDLVKRARAEGDPDLVRLALEYLPLTFSRRHGDPSRPWNAFDIQVHTDDGQPRLYYQGNWRDIFQNWEALSVSFPSFLPHMVAKFVNASTVDGFNPYRITSEGIDWEVPDPEDPWSNIGYWGDHQIVYLTRLLERTEVCWPGALADWLTERVFSYADVPYRLVPYSKMLADPRDTIRFEHEANHAAERRTEDNGTDGRLMTDADGEVLHVTLAEKLLVPILSKVCNLVLDGGIWMNTQRPEWNDANNALAGYGLSMVTVYQLRRHLALCEGLFSQRPEDEVALSAEVSSWLDATLEVLEAHRGLLDADEVSDRDRRALLDGFGAAFDAYRQRVYDSGLSAGPTRRLRDFAELCARALPYVDRSITHSRREDGLYHAYNLLHVEPDGDTARVEPLYEMLEGQAAILGSGVLEPEQAIEVIDALYDSRMYRADQDSFMLYPDRQLPSFLEMNRIPKARVDRSPLLRALAAGSEPRVLTVDDDGQVRFHCDLRNAKDLAAALDRLASDEAWRQLVGEHREDALDAWEEVFSHHAFTGRSGTMYGYEGLGCIYWHMVGKLLLSVQESLHWAEERGAPEAVRAALTERYLRVREGLGPAKSPEVYGAFPTDPYSHSARKAGARQPGMTGQVKEEIMTRFGEFGVRAEAGAIAFGPRALIGAEDFTAGGTLEFTLAEVPVTYRLGEARSIRVETRDGQRHAFEGARLPSEWAREILGRTGRVVGVEVTWPAEALRGGTRV